MFETAEVGHKLSEEEYKKREPLLRHDLLTAQYALLQSKSTPVVVLVGGVDGAGKGETVNLLNEWMDPRHIHTHAFGKKTEEERERPPMWRFWQALPPKGKIGILFGSWYTEPIINRVLDKSSKTEFARDLEDIRHFEKMLSSEGVLIIKLWFHLSKKAQQKRLKKLESDPVTRWRVTSDDWKNFKRYDDFRAISENALRETSTAEAPWHLIEGTDANYRYVAAGTVLLDAAQKSLAGKSRVVAPVAAQPDVAIDGRDVLNTLDHTQKLARTVYASKLNRLQGELNLLMRDKRMRERSLVIVFEGMDAAGKGSTIRRVTQAMDARHYKVIPIAAPSEEERAQPYLWRFWRHIPRRSHTVIFDRSWYGRVLVERVEGFNSEADWMRGYHEINEFEEQLVTNGAIVAKFWLAITLEEQLKRFREREKTPFKQFKITPDDWRNRKKWPQYQQAVSDMIERTSTEIAPWKLVAGNDKLFARVEVLKTLVKRLETSLA